MRPHDLRHLQPREGKAERVHRLRVPQRVGVARADAFLRIHAGALPGQETVTNAVRWTEEQLRDYQLRTDARGLKCSPGRGIAPDPKPAKTESKAERRFSQQLHESGLPPHFRNWFFMDGRDFELDFAWPGLKTAVEVQGGVHRIKGKFGRDIEKRALAMLAGWRVLEIDAASIRDGLAIEWTKRLLS